MYYESDDAKTCRPIVQELNAKRIQQEQAEQAFVLNAIHNENVIENQLPVKPATATIKKPSRWAQYVEEDESE